MERRLRSSRCIQSQEINDYDTAESLKSSYRQMKTKLDEMEEYNKHLESQLANIFSSISATFQKVDHSNMSLLQQTTNLKDIIKEEEDEMKYDKIELTSNVKIKNRKSRNESTQKSGTMIDEHPLHNIKDRDIEFLNVQVKENQKDIEAPCSNKNNEEKETYGGRKNKDSNMTKAFTLQDSSTLKELDTLESSNKSRRISSVDHRKLPAFSEDEKESRFRRVSTNTKYEPFPSSMGIKHKNRVLNSCNTSSENLCMHPNNIVKSNMDEMFLLPEKILEKDARIVHDDLTQISSNLNENVNYSKQSVNVFETSTASVRWKTIWMYRGIKIKQI